ncbi:MAG TPA: DUF1501 domain-containing protein [Isosphaeraceae bacterium]|nr:DUF1501 domain-containing protein [Isosphaeraceae bacterium]
MFTRRDFFARSLRDSTLIAMTPTLPGFLARTARAAGAAQDGRILVVVQLDGGNDGINTVVPFRDEGYARYRKAIRLPEKRLIKLNGAIGLHPAMGDAARLLESGRLAIVSGVGYPNPSRSHFRSRAIWQSARFDPREHTGLGWIGRALDGGSPSRDGAPAALLIGPDSPPPALRGRRSVSAALDRLDDYALTGEVHNAPATPADDLGQFLRRSLLDAYATADRFEAVAKGPDSQRSYPESELGRRLRLASRLIKAGLGTRVYYLEQGDYDTHGHQLARHAPLLEDLSSSLRAFLDDLAASRLADRVLVLVFSEFGRRVQENGTMGTDHGTAAPVFLAGPAVRPGLHGTYPSLTDLQDGDLKMSVDFRRVYAAILETWLGLPSRAALGGVFEPLPMLLT